MPSCAEHEAKIKAKNEVSTSTQGAMLGMLFMASKVHANFILVGINMGGPPFLLHALPREYEFH